MVIGNICQHVQLEPKMAHFSALAEVIKLTESPHSVHYTLHTSVATLLTRSCSKPIK